MDSFREQLLILLGTPIYIFIIGLEILLSNYRHQHLHTWKDTMTNIYLMILNSLLDLVFRGIYLVILGYFYQHRVIEFDTAILYWVILVLLEDFLYYWLHRFDHEIRLFWAVHVTHHSSKKMNFTVGFRSSVFQPLYRFFYFIPLALLGFEPANIVFIYSATQIWGIFVHTELINKMGWLEYVFVTPSHHRVHHSSNPKYLDKNMGMFLIIWDKLFGTFQEELPDSVYQAKQYGLTTDLENDNPGNIIFHEWKSIWKDIQRKDIEWKDKIQYVIGPPGWSHDGSRLTSGQLRAKESGDDANKDTSYNAQVT